MTIPLWVLLAYAVWTLLLLLGGIEAYRVFLIVTRRARPSDFPGGVIEGPPFYARAMRAHLNCVENLPVYSALALIAAVASIDTPWMDRLAIAVLIGRIGQSLTHLLFPVTDRTTTFRFAFFLVQIVAMLAMAILIARGAMAGTYP
jgi:uncharacterized MAPEG superfamily protein